MPTDSQVGDIIVQAQGALMPFVLRASGSDSYTFVGPTLMLLGDSVFGLSDDDLSKNYLRDCGDYTSFLKAFMLFNETHDTSSLLETVALV